MSEALLEAVRELRVAEPDLGFKPLLTKLREQQPDLGAATKEVRAALIALKVEGEAAKAAATLPAADEGALPAANKAAEGEARYAAQSGDEYEELMAKGARYGFKEDWRKAGKAYRGAIALGPDGPTAYHDLGHVLSNSGHQVEAAQRFLEAKERYPVGSKDWAEATADAFGLLSQEECDQVAKPEWWNDEGLKALSMRVVSATPNHWPAITMRADVLSGRYRTRGPRLSGGGLLAWKALGPRSAAELMEAATHFDRAAAIHPDPAMQAQLAAFADFSRSHAEAKAEPKATATLPATDESGAPPHVALSLACFGCARLPSDMDDGREKHDCCSKCVEQKLPTTYSCGTDCPGNPGAGELHAAYHKERKQRRKKLEDGGAMQQRIHEAAESQARNAAGDKYMELIAEGMRHASEDDHRKSARTYREAIALDPDRATAYFNLGVVLLTSGHLVEAAQRSLEAKERSPVGSELWAIATAQAVDLLTYLLKQEGTEAGGVNECNPLLQEEYNKVTKPEWWNDEALKALSARVVRAAPNNQGAHKMQAAVLSGQSFGTWEAKPRSAAELKKAATHYERAAALSDAPASKRSFAINAIWCRRKSLQLPLIF